MNLEQITTIRNRIAKAGAAMCVLFLLCALDGSVTYLREPVNNLRMLPGESVKLTGPMVPGLAGVTGMQWEASSELISMSLEQMIAGFWMGAKMWRGTLTLNSDIVPGKYTLWIYGKEDGKRVGANTFQVIVYKGRADYLSDSTSLLLRYTGVSPWIVAASFFCMVLLACGTLYLISGKRDKLMAEQGEAEIYHIDRNPAGISIYFGLGGRNGIAKGSKLVVMDSNRRPLEEVRVESVSDSDGVAKVDPLSTVRTGDLVRRL